eukprot:888144-Amorphochlora_amoeboformis.AAC.1
MAAGIQDVAAVGNKISSRDLASKLDAGLDKLSGGGKTAVGAVVSELQAQIEESLATLSENE